MPLSDKSFCNSLMYFSLCWISSVTTAVDVSDYGKGGRDTWTFLGQLVMGSMAGFVAGATLAMAWTALPAAASAVGLQASMWFGSSAFTAVVVPQIVTYAGYAIIGTSGLFALNTAIETGSGRNFICEYFFNDDYESYEFFSFMLDGLVGGITDLGNSNRALVSSDSSDDGNEAPNKSSAVTGEADDASENGNATKTANQVPDDANSPENMVKNSTAIADSVEDSTAATSPQNSNQKLGENEGVYIEQKQSKQEVLAQNREQGRKYEIEKFAEFSDQYTDAQEQITIVVESDGKKIKTRVDAIGLDKNGNVVIQEYKSSATAPLTNNQENAFPLLIENGGVICGKGKGEGPFKGGQPIKPGAKIEIVRPNGTEVVGSP